MRKIQIGIIIIMSLLLITMWVLLLTSGEYVKFNNRQKESLVFLTGFAVIAMVAIASTVLISKKPSKNKMLSNEEYWQHLYATSAQGYDSEELKNSQYDM